jgi:hypothetical protein
MIEFKKWISENVVGTEKVHSQIDHLYDKAKYAIKIVQLYSAATRQKILHNISTIAPLNSGVYGLYNSSENKKVIGQQAANKIKFKFGDDVLANQKMQKLPQYVIRQYLPDLDDRQIAPSDIIHVNVSRIVRELGDSMEAVLEIASTIVHEATHEIEFQTTGKTDEIGPKKAEEQFKKWAFANGPLIASRIPQLKFQSRSTM